MKLENTALINEIKEKAEELEELFANIKSRDYLGE